MTKIRRGGYLFVTWVGDDAPRHVHVYDGDKLVARWDLERNKVISGTPRRRIAELIHGLQREGRL